MVRVFIAIDIEDPLLVSRLARLRDTVVATGVPMKPVEEENFHITLRFIGEVDSSRVETIKEHVLSALDFRRFVLELKGLGAFPTPSRPRVVWVGVSKGFDEVRRVRDSVESRLRNLGFRPESKEFHPHVTLARIKGSKNISSLVRVLNDYSDTIVGEMTVSSIRLKKSTLTPRGPIYETLAEARLEP